MTQGPLEVTVGNAASPHIRKVWPIDPPAGAELVHVESHPAAQPGPVLRALRQAVAARGQVRRARRAGRPVVVRAHGAGRAGLVASLLVDPHPYVIIYGSEVVTAADRSWLSRTLTARTVRRASGLAVASRTLLPSLDRLVPGSSAKTDLVPMPVAWDAFSQGWERTGDPTPRVLSVRQIRPNYRIREVVAAHDSLGDDSRLALLRGAIAPGEAYLNEVSKFVRENAARVEVLEGFFDQAGLVDQDARTDVIVSVPDHDQMSVGMLEALGAGCVGVASELETYDFLKGIDHIFWVTDPSDVAEIREALRSALALAAAEGSPAQRESRGRAVRAAYERAFPSLAAGDSSDDS